MTTPVHEFLGIEKESMSPAVKSAITMGAITAGTTALAAVGTSQLQAGIQSAHDAVSRSIAFKKMMRDNPQLQKMDGKQARRYFNTLYNTAPELAKDPFAAGSWVRKVDEYDYVDPQSLKTLADTGSKLRQRRMEGTIPAFQLAQGAVQTGMGEYARLQDQMNQEARIRQQKKWDVVKGIAGVGKDVIRDVAKSQGSAMQDYRKDLQRYEDLERRQWEMFHSPGARGVGQRGGMPRPEYRRKYNRALEAMGAGQQPPEGSIPPFPMGTPPRRPESAFSRMATAIRSRFGK